MRTEACEADFDHEVANNFHNKLCVYCFGAICFQCILLFLFQTDSNIPDTTAPLYCNSSSPQTLIDIKCYLSPPPFHCCLTLFVFKRTKNDEKWLQLLITANIKPISLVGKQRETDDWMNSYKISPGVCKSSWKGLKTERICLFLVSTLNTVIILMYLNDVMIYGI